MLGRQKSILSINYNTFIQKTQPFSFVHEFSFIYKSIKILILWCLIKLILFCRHGVRQLRNPWADGPEFVTQCPIRPGGSYTYRFTITDQEGTLWWHAHSRWLRSTVYGALIIRPMSGSSYPFPTPKIEFPVILGTYIN